MASKRTRSDPTDEEVIASFFSEHGRAAPVDVDLDRHLADLARAEGVDEDFAAECRALLSEWTSDMVSRYTPMDPAERRAARERVLVARLHLAVDRPERAEPPVLRALSIAPADRAARSLLAALRHRQGRLTEAIRIWRELAEERESAEPGTLTTLARLFEIALRKRSDASFAVLPRDVVAVPALADFERVFEHALSHDPFGALRLVDRLLERHRGGDPTLFKLAALQRAWLLERAGDVSDAITTLERLADEPGLTHDIERLLTLAALYEREGSPQRLRRAVARVHHHARSDLAPPARALARPHRLSALG